jgi:hypothetical protein
MKVSCLFVISIVIITACGVSARTWHVTPGGTGDAPTIQAGIDSAAAGDTVALANGTFTGPGNRDIEYCGKAITVRSKSGDPDLCTVDCDGAGRAFAFQHGEGAGSVLEGITITRGYADWGGAIYLDYGAGPTIRGCNFVSNSAASWGGGGAINSDAMYTDLRITGCTFSSNTAAYGGAVYFYGQWFGDIVDSCLFTGNSAVYGGVVATSDGHYIGDFRNCTFVENSASEGGVVWTHNGTIGFVGCTFVKNSAAQGSAVHCHGGSSGQVEIRMYNCIVGYGTGGFAVDSEANEWSLGAVLNCCDVWGNDGGDWEGEIQSQLGLNGNFSLCPAFCNIAVAPYDFQLCDESPCLPGNHPDGYDCGLIGAWEEGCICGPTRTESTTWGGIKSLYR